MRPLLLLAPAIVSTALALGLPKDVPEPESALITPAPTPLHNLQEIMKGKPTPAIKKRATGTCIVDCGNGSCCGSYQVCDSSAVGMCRYPSYDEILAAYSSTAGGGGGFDTNAYSSSYMEIYSSVYQSFMSLYLAGYTSDSYYSSMLQDYYSAFNDVTATAAGAIRTSVPGARNTGAASVSPDTSISNNKGPPIGAIVGGVVGGMVVVGAIAWLTFIIIRRHGRPKPQSISQVKPATPPAPLPLPEKLTKPPPTKPKPESEKTNYYQPPGPGEDTAQWQQGPQNQNYQPLGVYEVSGQGHQSPPPQQLPHQNYHPQGVYEVPGQQNCQPPPPPPPTSPPPPLQQIYEAPGGTRNYQPPLQQIYEAPGGNQNYQPPPPPPPPTSPPPPHVYEAHGQSYHPPPPPQSYHHSSPPPQTTSSHGGYHEIDTSS